MTTKKYKLTKKLRAIYIIIGIISLILAIDNTYKTLKIIMSTITAITFTLLIFNEIFVALYRKKIDDQLAVKQLEELEKK